MYFSCSECCYDNSQAPWEAEEKESTKPWGTAFLLQHQGENLFQVSKAHQTLTHLSKIKSSSLSSLESRDTEDPINSSFPSFPDATLHIKSQEMSSCIYTQKGQHLLPRKLNLFFTEKCNENNSFSTPQLGGCLAAQEDQQGDLLLNLMCQQL